jgi:hypothetical protein
LGAGMTRAKYFVYRTGDEMETKARPDKEGYWWWLPRCFMDKGDNKASWSIIRYDERFDKEGKEGIFVGPLVAPVSTGLDKVK